MHAQGTPCTQLQILGLLLQIKSAPCLQFKDPKVNPNLVPIPKANGCVFISWQKQWRSTFLVDLKESKNFLSFVLVFQFHSVVCSKRLIWNYKALPNIEFNTLCIIYMNTCFDKCWHAVVKVDISGIKSMNWILQYSFKIESCQACSLPPCKLEVLLHFLLNYLSIWHAWCLPSNSNSNIFISHTSERKQQKTKHLTIIIIVNI